MKTGTKQLRAGKGSHLTQTPRTGEIHTYNRFNSSAIPPDPTKSHSKNKSTISGLPPFRIRLQINECKPVPAYAAGGIPASILDFGLHIVCPLYSSPVAPSCTQLRPMAGGRPVRNQNPGRRSPFFVCVGAGGLLQALKVPGA